MPRPRVTAITLDVGDLDRGVAFWGTLLGIKEVARYERYVWLDDVAPGLPLILQEVDEAHVVKNRMHLELAGGEINDVISRVEQLGGRRLADVDDPFYALTVLADPDGNEFCIARRPSANMKPAPGTGE